MNDAALAYANGFSQWMGCVTKKRIMSPVAHAMTSVIPSLMFTLANPFSSHKAMLMRKILFQVPAQRSCEPRGSCEEPFERGLFPDNFNHMHGQIGSERAQDHMRTGVGFRENRAG